MTALRRAHAARRKTESGLRGAGGLSGRRGVAPTRAQRCVGRTPRACARAMSFRAAGWRQARANSYGAGPPRCASFAGEV